MIPIDSEYNTLYIVYGLLLIYLLGGLFFSRKKKFFIYNLFFYLIYTGYGVYLFSDEENFKHGGSLVVIFYTGIFILIHIFLLVLIRFYYSIKNYIRKQ
jgi:hypothetical protein